MILVTKRDGTREPLDINKFHKVAKYACEGLSGVSISDLELKTHIQFYNGIKSSDIQETLIKAASDLISEDAPNYQYVAGRLINYQLRKEVYGQYDPCSLEEQYGCVMDAGYYDEELGQKYTCEEWAELNRYIDHDRDNLLTYAAMEQFRGKYLIKNRVTGKFYETPQMAFMLIAMTLFQNYKQDRIKWVKELYDAISTFDISLPTPIMAGVRSPQRQFSSCVLIETDDSLDSINATSSAIVKYVSQKAGIGIGGGRIRAIGSAIRNGDASHTGVIPFWKHFQSAVKSCSQGGVRGGAATLYYPIWHYEVEDLLVLKNNKGTEDNRIRHLDYGVQFNKVMYERLLTGGNITLFSPSDVPGLYDSFFTDTDEFRRLYEKYERNSKIRKKTVSAIDLFSAFMQERKDTGRIYFMNVDHANDHGSFIKEKAPIRMSNLCCEITLPTTPLKDINDENGEISLCTLAAINWGKIRKPSDFEKPCTIAVRALDALLDYQHYPVRCAEIGTRNRRPLGIGIINFAYWLARNDTNYSNPNLDLVHEYTEAWSYYLIKASVDLAKVNGSCLKNNDTKYSFGVMPIDTYKKDVDELAVPVYKMDWDQLREDAKTYGIRNSTLMALMPAETSAQISNSTNGIEPPRALISVKQSKDGVLKQVVPEMRKLKNKYELLWDQKSPDGYLKIMAVLQKFIDQAISVNFSYNPEYYPDNKIPMSVMLGHLLSHYKYGGKTGYYLNTHDGAGEIKVSSMTELEQGSDDDSDCDSCKI
jgi:ribonucleoside-diphosphate reductase alpha chain